MTVSATTFPLTALILPLLTSGAAWAIAIWALKQDGARIEFLRMMKPPKAASGHSLPSAPTESTHATDNE
jgi:hypothetical protein